MGGIPVALLMQSDRRHNETPDFLRIAKKRWGKAASITGNGRYALVARCDVTTITLWADLNIAKSSQKVNEYDWRVARCAAAHRGIKLSISQKAAVPSAS